MLWHCAERLRAVRVEIQRRSRGADSHRARYYSSLPDAEVSVEGEDYAKLPDTYVIFITGSDIIKKGKPYYEISRFIIEENMEFMDGSHIIYVNGEYEGDDEIGRLMHDFRCIDPHEMYHRELREPAEFFKENKEGERQMSTIMEQIRNEGKEEGRIQGAEENQKQTALRMIKGKILSDEEIAEYSGLPVMKIRELRDQESVLS